ncbi:MerR family transcriptional regulator [Streptomyces sp. NPDC050704]|uniref:MerR family transcriptional regulator n=1 Tax=Streptomyces sp. NPDC050704 TaxID=3157219 RepID=UPI003444BD7E
MRNERYSISFVARHFGMRVSALRYYDRLGLLTPVERKGNVRYYGRGELRRLALIQRLHRQGLVNLADTATLLADAPARGREKEQEREQPGWHDVLSTSADALQERIRHLQDAHRTLEHLLACPDPDPVRECPYLREQLDDAVDTALDTGSAESS